MPATKPRTAAVRGKLGHELLRAVLVGVVVALCVFGVTWPGLAADASGSTPSEAVDPDLYTRGGEVYQAACAACHGPTGEGGVGEGVTAAPPIVGLDLAYVDLTVRTGRMPIAEPSVGVRVEELEEPDREALAIYVADRFDLDGSIPEVEPGDAARGQEVYVRNCAACHGAAADGGISGANVRVPPLSGLDPIAIHEATRVGPFEMPAFDAAVLDDEDIGDMVAYLGVVDDTDRTAAGVREIDHFTAALFAGVLGLVAAMVVLVVARARRWHPREPEGFHQDPPFEPRR